jgi:hypothetical protein
MSSGWAFLEIEGERVEVQKAFDYIAGKGIRIQQLRQSK